jgi:hypothetical protein
MYDLTHAVPATDPIVAGGEPGKALLPSFTRIVARAPSTQSEAAAMQEIGANSIFWSVDTDDQTGDLDLMIIKLSGAAANRSVTVCTMSQVGEEPGDGGAPYWRAYPWPQTGHDDPTLTNTTPRSDAVTGGDQGDKEVTVAGDLTSNYAAGTVVRWDGSTGNDGLYSVASSSHAGGTTTIVLAESIPHATMDGTLYIDGRYLVPSDDSDNPTSTDTIIGIDVVDDEWLVSGDQTAKFTDGDWFRVVDGDYEGGFTCDGNSTEAGGVTTIAVKEDITDQSYSVHDITASTKTIRISGDCASSFTDGHKFILVDTDSNDDTYTCDGDATYDGSDYTSIVVDEAVIDENSGNGYAYATGQIKIYPTVCADEVELPAQDSTSRDTYAPAIFDAANDQWYSPRGIIEGMTYVQDSIVCRDADSLPISVAGQYASSFSSFTSYPVIRCLHISRIDTTLCPRGCIFARWSGAGSVMEIYYRHHVTGQLYRGEITFKEEQTTASASYDFLCVQGDESPSGYITLRAPWRYNVDGSLVYQDWTSGALALLPS